MQPGLARYAYRDCRLNCNSFSEGNLLRLLVNEIPNKLLSHNAGRVR